MRVVFAGTPPFAAQALGALVDAGHEVVLVLTQPDRPSGRGLKLSPSAVARAANEFGVAVERFPTLKIPDAQQRLREVQPDVMVVAAYGLILPRSVLEIPRLGCLNIHASLLPRWRGAAPIQRAILAADASTGICIMQMDEGLDTGPVLLRKTLPIGARDTTGSLTEKLAILGAESITETLGNLPTLVATPQDSAKATYAAKISRTEARLDWSLPCDEVERRIRAFNPVPGAEGLIGEETIKIWEAEPVHGVGGPAGSVLRAEGSELIVACGSGSVRLNVLQRPGGRKMGAGDFMRGKPLNPAPLAFLAKNSSH